MIALYFGLLNREDTIDVKNYFKNKKRKQFLTSEVEVETVKGGIELWEKHGRRLRGTGGTVPTKFEVGEWAMHSSPNISRNSVIGKCESTNV